MPFTLAQKMAMSKAQLIIERDRYMVSNPEYAVLNTHVTYRTNLEAYGEACKQAALNGPGELPPGSPPTPPGA